MKNTKVSHRLAKNLLLQYESTTILAPEPALLYSLVSGMRDVDTCM
jgi:hypothetical protein